MTNQEKKDRAEKNIIKTLIHDYLEEANKELKSKIELPDINISDYTVLNLWKLHDELIEEAIKLKDNEEFNKLNSKFWVGLGSGGFGDTGIWDNNIMTTSTATATSTMSFTTTVAPTMTTDNFYNYNSILINGGVNRNGIRFIDGNG